MLIKFQALVWPWCVLEQMKSKRHTIPTLNRHVSRRLIWKNPLENLFLVTQIFETNIFPASASNSTLLLHAEILTLFHSDIFKGLSHVHRICGVGWNPLFLLESSNTCKKYWQICTLP